MRKKGQAAMEFLMTYGWAILAAVIVVGVLWFLIGNPANLAGNRFQISAPLVANAMSITAGAPGTIDIEIRNGAAETITVTEITIEGCAEPFDVAPDQDVLSGELQAFAVTDAACTLNSGDRFNGDVTVIYRTAGSTTDQQVTGSISGRIP